MSVTNAETFKLSGGSCVAKGDDIVLNLASKNITATNSSGVITVTNSSLTGAEGTRLFETLVRVANANQAKLTYVAAS